MLFYFFTCIKFILHEKKYIHLRLFYLFITEKYSDILFSISSIKIRHNCFMLVCLVLQLLSLTLVGSIIAMKFDLMV